VLQPARSDAARAVKDRLKLGLRFEAEAMRLDLGRLETSDWIEHFVPQHYEGSWSVLPLRAPAAARHPIQMIYSDPSCEAFVDTPLLARCEYLRQVLGAFQCPLQAVRLMKLTPGSVIRPHADHDLAAEQGHVRLHIPIATNADVDFQLNGEPVVMQEGECWYLRLSDTHSVANRGQSDRIHLVVDTLVTPWLEEQLTNAECRETERDALAGWIPIRVRTDTSPPVVDWCDLAGLSFTDPFFEQTVQRGLRSDSRTSGVSAIRTTPVETLIERAAACPGIPPTAFIFHTSRCGSTLVSQMAAALPRTIAISEAPPIDHVLRARAPETDRLEWLRAVVAAVGQPRRGDERHLFVKFDAWHILDLAIVQRAFPRVPCLLLYRDPAAVVASQLRMPGLHMVPGLIDPSLISLDLAAVLQLDRNEYVGRMLGAIYEAGLVSARKGLIELMNYRELPEAASTRLLEWCGLTGRGDVLERIMGVAQFDAKTPSLPYNANTLTTVSARNAQAIAEACEFVSSHYEGLESIHAL
jgi:Aspartyl/Asparaginyl beta-hydroxylase